MTSAHHLGRPEFVVAGWATGDGVCLLASREVYRATLEVHREYGDTYSVRSSRVHKIATSTRTELDIEVGQFVIVQGPHWRSALEGALRKWSPDQPGDTWK